MSSISSPSVLPGPTVVPTLSAPTLWAATPAPVNLDSSPGLRTQVCYFLILLLTSLNTRQSAEVLCFLHLFEVCGKNSQY